MTFQRLQALVQEAHANSKALPVKCCGCHRVRVDGHWGGTIESGDEALYSHGYCPSCYTSAMAQLSLCQAVTH